MHRATLGIAAVLAILLAGHVALVAQSASAQASPTKAPAAVVNLNTATVEQLDGHRYHTYCSKEDPDGLCGEYVPPQKVPAVTQSRGLAVQARAPRGYW